MSIVKKVAKILVLVKSILSCLPTNTELILQISSYKTIQKGLVK